ncbi:MAG: hypothetical protein ABMA13_12395 [Chthoniobacteraceae bacterium]
MLAFKPDRRFFDDDMATLAGLGLLIAVPSSGDPQYRLTRAGERFIRELARPGE